MIIADACFRWFCPPYYHRRGARGTHVHKILRSFRSKDRVSRSSHPSLFDIVTLQCRYCGFQYVDELKSIAELSPMLCSLKGFSPTTKITVSASWAEYCFGHNVHSFGRCTKSCVQSVLCEEIIRKILWRSWKLAMATYSSLNAPISLTQKGQCFISAKLAGVTHLTSQ